MRGKEFEPTIIAFCCRWSAYRVADIAGVSKVEYPSNVRIIKVPCSGRVSSTHILQAFSLGADGVIVSGCLKGGCHYVDGNLKAKRRVEQLKKMLNAIGLNGDRLEMYFVGSCNLDKLVNYMKEFTERIRKLGPNPLKT